MAGKVVLVTGGANGIGYATAERFGRAGCKVVITDRDEPALAAAAGTLTAAGVDVASQVVDVTDQERVEEVAAWLLSEYGRLDVLVNNAGIGLSRELAETTRADWQRLIDINVWGVLNNTYAFLPLMIERGSGHIVNVSSGQAFFRMPTWGAYAATKVAVQGFSEVLRQELRKHGIGVTTIFPYLVNTGFYTGMEGETLTARMTLKFMPLISHTPQKAAAKIFAAVRKNKAKDLAHPMNAAGYYTSTLPLAPRLVGRVMNQFLLKGA